MLSKEQKLESKIKYFEDMLLRCKSNEYERIEELRRDLMKLRISLQKMKWENIDRGW